MSNISELESVVAEVHAECLRNLREGRSQEEVQTRVGDLPLEVQGLQQEYLEITACLLRPPEILAEAPGRLTTALGSLSSVLIIMQLKNQLTEESKNTFRGVVDREDAWDALDLH